MCPCTHVRMCPCTHVLMYSCTHVLMYSCFHVLMYPCTPLSVEPDLCEVVSAARPADQRAVRWWWRTVFDTRQIVFYVSEVTGGPDDGVLTSDTWEEGTAGVSLASWSSCYAVTMILCQLTMQIPLLCSPWRIIRKPFFFLTWWWTVRLTLCRMCRSPDVLTLPGWKYFSNEFFLPDRIV